MKFDQVTCDGQAEPEAAMPSRARAISLAESLKHMRKKFRLGMPGPLSITLISAWPFLRFTTDLHQTAGRRKLHGIREQVPGHLLQTLGIAANK